MKRCAFCGRELPHPADEYGHPEAPTCLTCWKAQNNRLKNRTNPPGLTAEMMKHL